MRNSKPTRNVTQVKPAAARGGDGQTDITPAMHEAARIIPRRVRFGFPEDKAVKLDRPAKRHTPESGLFTGDAWIEVRNQLVVENLTWAHDIARRVARKLPSWFLPEDLMGAVEIALIKLADQYRAYRAVPFRAFARPRIGGACYDAIRRKEYKERGHSELSDRHVDAGPNPETLAQLEEMKGIWAHVHKLPGQYSRVICLIYGDELTQAEVARRVGMSEPWVSLAHGKALGMLREMVSR